MPSNKGLDEPWRSFLHAVDDALSGVTELHCFGGFVFAEYYGLMRPTADVHILEARGSDDLRSLAAIAGRHSALARKHRVFLDIVTVANVPDRYDERLTSIFPGEFERLRLKALEKHDLALAKLGRNADHDREDVKRLALGPGLDLRVLETRYRDELRFQFGQPERADLTLRLWIDMIGELGTGR